MTNMELIQDKMLFFGVGPRDRSGHFWHVEGGALNGFDAERLLPERLQVIDGVLQPGCVFQHGRWYCHDAKQTEGEALLHYVDGWTAVSFWDRSADPRGACNGNFVLFGRHAFAEMIERSKAAFPELWKRFTFAIVCVGIGHQEAPCSA